MILLALLLILGFCALNTFYFFKYRSLPLEGDAKFYYTTGKNIAAGRGFTYDGINPTIGYPIGYPLFVGIFMSLFGSSRYPIFIAQIILCVLTMAMLYKMVASYDKKSWTRYVPLLFFVGNYRMISGNYLIMSETLSYFLAVLFLYSLWRFFACRRVALIALSGLSLGALVITRPSYQYFLLLLVPYLIFWTVRMKNLKLLLFFVTAAIVTVPVLARNNRHFGAPKFAFHGGMSLFQGTYLPYKGVWHEWEDRTVTIDSGEVPPVILAKIKGKGLNETDDVLVREGIKNIVSNGLWGIPLYLGNISRLLFGFPYRAGFLSMPLEEKYYMVFNICAVLLFLSGLWYCARTRMLRDPLIMIEIIFVLYTVLSLMFVAVMERFGLPCLAVVYAFTSLGLKRPGAATLTFNGRTL